MKNEKYQNIEIKSLIGGGVFTEISIDGHKLRGVRGYKMEQRAGEVPVLTLELNALNIAVDQPMLLMADGFGEMEIVFKEPQGGGS